MNQQGQLGFREFHACLDLLEPEALSRVIQQGDSISGCDAATLAHHHRRNLSLGLRGYVDFNALDGTGGHYAVAVRVASA